MFDEPALKLLQQTAIGDYFGKQEKLAGTGTIALPDNFKIHDLERFSETRRRFRGHLQTNSLSDFVVYTSDEGRKGSDVFIDADNLAATAIFDLGDSEVPGHAEHTATLELDATAAYAALLNIDGKRLEQRTLIDWIEDWSEYLQAYAGNPGEPKPLSEALAAIRQVKITKKREAESTEDDFRGTRSVLEEAEASARVGLPGGFLFTTEPYLGLPSRQFRVRLAVFTNDEKPTLNLRIVRLDQEKQEIAKDFKAVLLRELADKATLTIGTFKA